MGMIRSSLLVCCEQLTFNLIAEKAVFLESIVTTFIR
jgi:hypothetical protein